jgi:hypothetical protein
LKYKLISVGWSNRVIQQSSKANFKLKVYEKFQIAMTLKRHKNLIANGATAAVSWTQSGCWLPGDFVRFGLVNPDTLATSNMLGERSRDQQGSSIERPTGVYLFRHQ